jgi:hypothetical protein
LVVDFAIVVNFVVVDAVNRVVSAAVINYDGVIIDNINIDKIRKLILLSLPMLLFLSLSLMLLSLL